MRTAQVAMVEERPTPDLNVLRSRISERLSRLGISANEASRRASLGMSYVNDILGGKSRKPVPHRLGQLADVLECDLDYLMGEQESPRRHLKVVRDTGVGAPAAPAVPLYTVGLPDAHGFFEIDEKSKVEVPVAFNLAVPQTYGVVVPDDSNAPRYFAGEYVIAHPNRPVSRGGFAVIRMKDGRATIRRVDAILSDKVMASCLEGPSTVEIARDEIEAIHRIIGAAEQA